MYNHNIQLCSLTNLGESNYFISFLSGHAVLRRVKVTFLDTVLRIEHIPENSKTGIALEIRINKYVFRFTEEIHIAQLTFFYIRIELKCIILCYGAHIYQNIAEK